MRQRPTVLAAVLTASLWTVLPARVAAQAGIVPLDSLTLVALSRMQDRLRLAPRARIRTPWATSVLENPRLVKGGLAYDQASGDAPRGDFGAFRLDVPGHAVRQGAQAGAITGGVLGVVSGLILSGLGCIDAEGRCSADFMAAIVLGGVGTLSGALIGALAGALVPGWETIYGPDPFR